MCSISFVIRIRGEDTVNQWVTLWNMARRNAGAGFAGRRSSVDVGREVFEEVVTEYAGYAAQERGVDTLALEYVVDVLPVAVQLAGEPRNAALLPAQFLLYLVADMYHGG